MKRFCVGLLIALAPGTAAAQLRGMGIEVFAGGGAVGGISPVVARGSDRTLLFGGARAEAGIQGENVGGGLELHYWEFRPTTDLGGEGVDLTAFLEFRRERASRTTLRLGLGVGDESFDGGSSGTASSSHRGFDAWLVGVGHEVPLTTTGRLLLTVMLINPSHESDVSYRKMPTLEFGIGYRGRAFQSILPLPGGR